MNPWIKSLRLPMCLLAGLLTVMGFRMVQKDPPWLTVLAVVFIACSTMLQNDWRDRYHDVKKGKELAVSHPKSFLLFLLVFWSISLVLTIGVSWQNWNAGILLVSMGVVGLVYSEIRGVPMASILLTAITSGSPILLPMTTGARENLWLMFGAVALVIFGREITKDLEDKSIDGNYKWTLPLILGSHPSKLIAFITIAIGVATTLSISLLVLFGLSVSTLGLVRMVKEEKLKEGRAYLDAGLAITILTITLRG